MKKTKKKTATAAKRKGKRTKKTKRFMAPIARPLPPGFTLIEPAPRPLSLPELWCKIETPVSVRFMESMRPDDAASLGDGRKRPAMLARVYDMSSGETKDLALPERLAGVFAVIPQAGYVGRAYNIRRHRRHERKNAAGYTITEIVEKPAS
jgi:hypothetical protein